MTLSVSAFPAPLMQNRRRRSDDFDIDMRIRFESPQVAERRIKPKSSLLGLFARSTTQSPVQDIVPDSVPSSSTTPPSASSPRQTCKLGQKILKATETVFMFRNTHHTLKQPDANLSPPLDIAVNPTKKGSCVPLQVDSRPLKASSSISQNPEEGFTVERTTRSLDNPWLPERDLVSRPSASSPVIFARLTSSCEISPISLGDDVPKERRKLVPPFFVNRSLYSGGCRWEATGDRDRSMNNSDTASSFSLGTISTSTSVESLAITRISRPTKSPISKEGNQMEVVELEGPCLDHASISESIGDGNIADDDKGTVDIPWILDLCSSVGMTALDLSLLPSPVPANSDLAPGQSRYRTADASGAKIDSSPSAQPSTCPFFCTRKSSPTAVEEPLTLGVHRRPLPPIGPRARPLPPVPTRPESLVPDNRRGISSLPHTNNTIITHTHNAALIPNPPAIRNRLFSPLFIKSSRHRPKSSLGHAKTLPPLPYSPSSSSFHGPSVTPLSTSPFHNADPSQPILTSPLRSHTLPYDRSHLEDRSSQGFNRRLVHV